MFHTVLASASRRTAFTSSTRAFHYSPVANKSVVDKVKEVADNVCSPPTQRSTLLKVRQVNKTVGKSLAGAIEKGEQATDAAKSAAGEHLDLQAFTGETDAACCTSGSKGERQRDCRLCEH